MSEGLTRTERLLARLGRRSFLSLWSHANVYRDKGKELTDLLVVCHNIVLIFSDKEVAFDRETVLPIAWPRWYNRAVKKSVPQLKRAKGWIERHPDRLFFDAKCERPLGLLESLKEPLEIHTIAVANGASSACIDHFGGGSGSLMVSPLEGDNPDPFCLGVPTLVDGFVHVFDEGHLHVLLQELDTVRDFADYLVAREKVIKGGNLYVSASEEDLLAVYLKDVNEKGEHDFVWKSGVSLSGDQKIAVVEGSYKNLRKAKPYKEKKAADKISYLWDRLIEKFTHHLRSSSMVPVPAFLGQDGRGGEGEIGLRYMALQRRVERRSHAEAILGAFDILDGSKTNRFFRAMLPPPGSDSDTGFCILLLKRDGVLSDLTYDQYREVRASTLAAYSESLLEGNRNLRRVVGIATEGVRSGNMSEDLIYHEPPEWTDEAIAAAKERAKIHEIMGPNLKMRNYSTKEYPGHAAGLKRGSEYTEIPYRFIERPPSPVTGQPGNRKQRRAAKAKRRSR